MANDYSYENCYKILNSTPEEGWKKLRSNYKTLIQRHHPDRFEDESEKKIVSEHKIKELNKAYQHLSKYYRENDSLPIIEEVQNNSPQTPIVTKPAPPKASPKRNTHTPQKKTTKTKNTSLRNIFLLSLITLTIVYLFFYSPNHDNFDHVTDTQKYKKQNQKKQTTEKTQDAETKENSKKAQSNIADEETITEKRFTYGSSIGEVIMIQGEPTKIEGSTWFYGNAKIFFKNGAVQGWERTIDSPLKASISNN